jgi:hypothetical protein
MDRMGIKERHTIKQLNDFAKSKIDLDYFRLIYQHDFNTIQEVPQPLIEMNFHFNRSSRIIFICHHLHEFKKMSFEMIARRYGMSKKQIRTFVDAYREMKSTGVLNE